MEDEWDYISDKDRIAGLRDEIKRKSREGMDLLAERDRLAAENAELKRCGQQFEITAKGCVRALENEKKELTTELAAANARNAQLWRGVGIAIRLKNKYYSELAAANAALESLREKVPEGTRWCSDCEKMTPPDADDPDFCAECEGEDVWTRGALVDIQAILYPKETTDDNG